MDKVLDFLKGFLVLSSQPTVVRTAYTNRPVITYEVVSKETITEKHGYKSLMQQVNDLLMAGERLDAYRREGTFYDSDYFDDDHTGFVDDPTRSPDFDGFAAHDAALDLERTSKNNKKKSRAKKSNDKGEPKETVKEEPKDSPKETEEAVAE